MLQAKPKDFFRDRCNPYFESIKEASFCILNLPCKDRLFNPYQFTNQKFKQKKHPVAVNQTLQALIIYWPDIKDPWRYANKVLATVNGNWNEKDHISEYDDVKKEFAAFVAKSEDLRFLVRDIGRL